uniref:uncharacterized protein C4orf51 homolog isoform X2 n=1 Tax=Myodes glareolus TaxID=447135 RepID=UPI0020208EED|nr:uncharacterized protein C4orf51 homolog isoform X2 [Myodes glareolus]
MSHFFYLAPEILLPFSPLTSKEFELIRRKARELWQDETQWSASSVTTYAGSYRGKQLDEAACRRLVRRGGQPQFQCKPTPLPSCSAYGALPGQAGSQEAADGKGGHPGVPRLSQNSMPHVKHKVAHQIWGSEAPCPTPLDYRTLSSAATMGLRKQVWLLGGLRDGSIFLRLQWRFTAGTQLT